MEKLRRMHNDAKSELIRRNVKKGDMVLDVGCGRGGDLHKYQKTGCILMGIDPDADSVAEAQKRAQECGYTSWSKFYVGDILSVNDGLFDVICFNFSLQYTFVNETTLNDTVGAIARLLRPGGKLIGVVPDANKIIQLPCKWSDRHGNSIEHGDYCRRTIQAGNMIIVKLADGPYYANGPIPEPLCYNQILFTKLSLSFELVEWSSLVKGVQGTITDIYSKFIFKRT